MRTIKFRAWDINNSRMIVPYFFEPTHWEPEEEKHNEPMYILYEDFHELEDGHERLGFVMQFTGLVDKNGKEIYEGDVLSFEDKFEYYVVYEDAKFVCKHAAKSNSLQGITWGPLHRFFDPDFLVYGGVEVIGNIHEHPELLKQ